MGSNLERFSIYRVHCPNLIVYCYAKHHRVTVNPRANGAKRRSGRKPGARVTNRAYVKFKVDVHGRWVRAISDPLEHL